MSQDNLVTFNDKTYITAAKTASKQFTYGDIISKNWLIKHFKLIFPKSATQKEYEKLTFEFLTNLESFKTILLEEYKMHLLNSRGKGYQIVMPNDQADIAMNTMKSALKKEFGKAVKVLTHINEELLTLEDIKRRDEHQCRVAAMDAFTKRRIEFK